MDEILFNIFTWELVIGSLIGMWMSIKKDRRCFVIWGITNICWVFVNLYKGIPAEAFGCALVVAFSIYGWMTWGAEDGG